MSDFENCAAVMSATIRDGDNSQKMRKSKMKIVTIKLTQKTAKQILKGQIQIEGNNRIRNVIKRQIADGLREIERKRLEYFNRIVGRKYQITPRVTDHSDA